MAKKLKRLKTGALARSLSIARLTLGAGTRAAGAAVAGLLDSEVAARARSRAHWLAQASRLVAELGKLKGSLMKAGQLLSLYGEHFLPPEISELLRTLQSESPPVEFAEVHKVLARNLGKEKLAGLEIDPEPCGAASLGQVHRARRKADGADLALKVQYPGVERAIDGDVKALRRLLALTELLPKVPATEDLFEEVRSMLKREVNYPLELEMLRFYGTELAGDARYVVPRPYPELCGKRVLAMSFEPGLPLAGPAVAAFSQERRNALALAVLDLYFRELFVWRRVQTDPHFGNYRVRAGEPGRGAQTLTAGPGEPGRGAQTLTAGPGEPVDALVLYDFGAVRDLDEKFLGPYRRMLQGTFHGDRAHFERAAHELGLLAEPDPQELKDLFWSLCLMITEPFLPPQPFDWSKSDLPKRLAEAGWKLARQFPLRTPPREHVFLDRKMAGNFTLLAKLGAKIDGRALLERYL